MTKRLLVSAVVTVALASTIGIAQQSPSAENPTPPAFEVASVKTNKSGEMGARIQRQPGGRFNAINMPLRDLIMFSYQVRPFQIEGAPDWIGPARYDIVAKAESEFPLAPPGGAPPPDMLMLRTLLADRFKLVVHFETKEMPIYTLSVARPDGRLGPQLTPSTTDCAALMKERMGRGGAPPPPAPGGRMECGMAVAPNRLMGGGFPISELSNMLSVLVQRTVVDRTGLTGNYDVVMTFQPEQLPGPGGAVLPPPAAAAGDSNAPSLFTAVQEQLGLKLESSRGPVQVLVIDRVEPPTED